MSQPKDSEVRALQIRQVWSNSDAGRAVLDYFRGWVESDPVGVQCWLDRTSEVSRRIAACAMVAPHAECGPSLTFRQLTAVDPAGTQTGANPGLTQAKLAMDAAINMLCV